MRLLSLTYPAALILASACEQAPSLAPAVNSPDGAPPSFSTANGPDNAGRVVRFEAAVFLTEYPDRDLVVRHYNAEDIDFCGGSTSGLESWAFQDVLTPGAVVELAQSGEIPVYVYRFSEVPPFVAEELPPEVLLEVCADLKEKWIYRGTHHFRSHDNDLFGDPTRANAFGFTAEGTVFDRAGGKHAYRESLVFVWDPRTGRVIRESPVLSIK